MIFSEFWAFFLIENFDFDSKLFGAILTKEMYGEKQLVYRESYNLLYREC